MKLNHIPLKPNKLNLNKLKPNKQSRMSYQKSLDKKENMMYIV